MVIIYVFIHFPWKAKIVHEIRKDLGAFTEQMKWQAESYKDRAKLDMFKG